MLLVQVNIEDIISPVISDHARSILNRFPSWSKTFEDSLERSTPELALPETNSGKFINALIGENLDKIDEYLSKIELDSFISSADLNEIAWMYVYAPVQPGFIKVVGDNVELARLSTMKELVEHRVTDNVFFYNFSTNQIFTIKKIVNLKVDDVEYDQIVVQSFNSFDNFGLMVGLQRLYLEDNLNFSKRILDVNLNPPSINEEGFKLTLRRELDIWRAYGSTPDSEYLGATPELIEITDMELMSKYFSKDGIPTKDFYDFVEFINTTFPTNYGYIKWNEAYWDYAGRKNEGIFSIPQITDAATPESYIEIFQPGIGDFEDARIKLEKVDQEINNYSFGLRVRGIKYDGFENAYEPIRIKYDSYLSYLEEYVDNEVATINYDVTVKLNLHGNIQNDSVYTARYQDIVRNQYGTSSSPEFVVRSIFNPSGFTNGGSIFYDDGGTPYINTFDVSATESYTFTQIPLFAVDEATVSFVSSTNESGATGDYAVVGFLDATPYAVASSSNARIVKTSAEINDSAYATNLRIGSKIYSPNKFRESKTPKIRSNIFGNVLNNSSNIEQQSPIIFTPQDILKNIVVPNGAIPQYVHIDNVVDDSYNIDHSTLSYSGYGGLSLNRETGDVHLIPASPNIIFSYVNPNFATPDQMPNYVNTVSATANYYFAELKFPYDATPDYFVISSADSDVYPFNTRTWEKFTADLVSEKEFYIGPNGVISDYSTVNYDLVDSLDGNLVGRFDLSRGNFALDEYSESKNLWISEISVINESDEVEIYAVSRPTSILAASDGETGSDIYDNTFMDQARWFSLLQRNQATPEGILNYFDENSNQYIIKNLPVYANYRDIKNKKIIPSIKTGWYYQNGEERYIYAKPETNTSDVNAGELLLEGVARQGAPIICVVTNIASNATQNYTQVSFFDEATPTAFSYHNYEYVQPKHQNFIPLAYPNVFDVDVIDTFTGQTIISGASYENNAIDLTSSATPIVIPNREYKVRYRVKDTFYIDNEYYSEIDNSYRTYIKLLSTPNYNWTVDATYESAIFDSDTEIEEMVLNPLLSPIDHGFIYLSHNEYDMASLEASLSPKVVLQQTNDFMALNVWSKDINKNPKPYRTINIQGSNSVATPSFVTTNEDGYARAYIKYDGANTKVPVVEYVYLTDSVEDISATVSYRSIPKPVDPQKLSAEVTKKIMNAGEKEYLYVYGNATPNARVYWRKGRTLYDTLQTYYSGSNSYGVKPGSLLEQTGLLSDSGAVSSDQNGDFEIGPFIAEGDATPGYWFVVVDSELKQSTSENPVTIAGDIVYWYERYDVNQSNSEEPVLQNIVEGATDYYHYLDVPVFKKSQVTNEVYYEDSATNYWNLPKWYPISRFDQYKIGTLGSTPYIINSYDNLRPDYEEE